jgi:uncharacterized glyoxalase superfamily protein PhnB
VIHVLRINLDIRKDGVKINRRGELLPEFVTAFESKTVTRFTDKDGHVWQFTLEFEDFEV